MAKKSATSLDPSEQNVMSRLGSKLPKGLERQDRKATLPGEVSVQTPPKPKAPKQTVTEEYFDRKGKSQVHNPGKRD